MTVDTFYTAEADKDGYAIYQHTTGYTANNTGTLMYVGKANSKPLGETYNDDYRSFVSFDTSSIPSNATITNADVYFYYAGKAGTKAFTFLPADINYPDPEVKVSVGSDQIGDEVNGTDFYIFSGTVIQTYNRATFTGWGATAGYKTISCTNYINKSGFTDFMIWPNEDFIKHCENASKYYYLQFQTVETAFTIKDPKLIVTYTVPEGGVITRTLLGVGI